MVCHPASTKKSLYKKIQALRSKEKFIMCNYVLEPERKIPVIAETDLLVAGGSCTGVFAAVRAARLGLKVVLIEQQGLLGGTAVSGLVNVWHSLYDTNWENQVIAGMTSEVIERLKIRDGVIEEKSDSAAYTFNPWELTLILDSLIRENKITLMLHTSYAGVLKEKNILKSIIVENTDGRGAISAKFFIDATGHGRIAKDLNIPHYTNNTIQPPTSCYYLRGETGGIDIGKLINEHGKEFGLADDWGWSQKLIGCEGIRMRADNHVFNVRCDRAADLTYAELEGRRLAGAVTSMLKKYGHADECYNIVAMCSHIGIRETVHYNTKFKADRLSLLTGQRYEAPVLNGTYRVDVHHSEDMGITFQYLDGKEEIFYGKNSHSITSDWRKKENISTPPATFYQIPFDILVNEEYQNFIVVGRMINADEGAFGALRVMVNLNQLGEAAGVAAYLCIQDNQSLQELNGKAVTEKLRKGGSAL